MEISEVYTPKKTIYGKRAYITISFPIWASDKKTAQIKAHQRLIESVKNNQNKWVFKISKQ